MGGPSIASLKFAFWLLSVTFLLHCLMIPTAVTDMNPRSYKENRGVRRTGLMPREAYVPTSIKSKRFNRGLCGVECVVKKWCRSFNVDQSTGKCELFGNDPGGSLVDDPNSSYFATMSISNENHCILLIGGTIGNDAAPVEYYNPIEGAKCNVDIIGTMSTERIRDDTKYTSGCYLSSTQQIVIRESWFYNPNKPPMVYELNDGSAKPLPLPHSKYTVSSTAVSVGSSKCLSCGGYTGGTLNNCYQFDPTLNESNWTPIAPMPDNNKDAALVSLTINDFYVTGGYNGGIISDKVYRFDVGNGKWHTEASMSAKRYYHAAAPLSKTEFIVCGGGCGYDHSPTLSSCEIYDTALKTWRATGSLNQGRQGLQMITFGGNIYALGGHNGFISVNTVEKYDRATGEWKMAKAMKHSRYSFIGLGVF